MGNRRGLSQACWVIFLGPFLPGCAMLNSFLDPTTVGQFPREYQERGIRRILTPRDTPIGPPNATEPTAEDLVPIYEDYRLAPGDIVMVIVQDLLGPGAPEQLQLEVSFTGNIRIPQLGTVKLTGLTEHEAEQELKARLREANLLPNPDVRVYAQMKHGRTFTIRGAVGRAGQYPIAEPNMRLLDVIGLVGDIGPNVPRVYVIRRGEHAPGHEVMEPLQPAPKKSDLIIEPPPEEEFRTSFSAVQGVGYQEPPPPTRPAEPPLDKKDLEAVLLPAQETRPATRGATPELEPRFPPLIFEPETGKAVPREPEARAPAPPVRLPEVPPTAPAERPFDWEQVPEVELEQRVIEIDVRALLAGDARYNIVVRNHDTINVPIDTGIYYLMGEVNRPGAFAFNGRDVTIKQATALAGGLSPMAWPQRCEIIRHEPGTDKQITIPINLDAIFAGLSDDIFLRDDDVVNVGTHFVSPFLFVIRNSFRFTYGFGFVYDRNFADKDAYSSKINPQILEAQRRQQQGLPF